MTTPGIPEKQKAWIVVRRGKPKDALVLKTDAPVPSTLKPGEVLVKVQAAALNPVGYKLMGMLPNFIAKRPLTAESDFTGIVANGNGTRWLEGEAVFGTIPYDLSMKTKQGALTEYTVVPADHLATRPANITPVQAAGVGIVGFTAWQAVFDYLKMEEGQHLFVYGASTSVGVFAIQFAKAKGIKVTASASEKNREFVKALGADDFIDYTKEDIAAYLAQNPPTPKFHGILDAFGLPNASLYANSEKYLAPGGIYASVGPQPHGLGDVPKLLRLIFDMVRPTWLGGVKRKFALVTIKVDTEDLNEIQDLLATGKISPRIDSVYNFEDVLPAYDRIMTGRATGKIVVKVDPSID
ncbi:NAD(P)-binding protein [Dentipellis sp. KUC8613]|nr:NAD(P)-binding protein [Dentipellis sp. KUC8613]